MKEWTGWFESDNQVLNWNQLLLLQLTTEQNQLRFVIRFWITTIKPWSTIPVVGWWQQPSDGCAPQEQLNHQSLKMYISNYNSNSHCLTITTNTLKDEFQSNYTPSVIEERMVTSNACYLLLTTNIHRQYSSWISVHFLIVDCIYWQ